MIIRMLIIIMCIIPTTLSAQPLQFRSQGPCNPRETTLPHTTAVEKLKMLGEVSVGLGVSPDGTAVTEIFVNHETKSWTIVATGTDGRSCMKAAGKGWYFKKGIIPGADINY